MQSPIRFSIFLSRLAARTTTGAQITDAEAARMNLRRVISALMPERFGVGKEPSSEKEGRHIPLVCRCQRPHPTNVETTLPGRLVKVPALVQDGGRSPPPAAVGG